MSKSGQSVMQSFSAMSTVCDNKQLLRKSLFLCSNSLPCI